MSCCIESYELSICMCSSIRERGIGAWNGVLNFMATFAILTNCVLFAFASEQMAVYFPQYFGDDAPDPSLSAFYSLRFSLIGVIVCFSC